MDKLELIKKIDEKQKELDFFKGLLTNLKKNEAEGEYDFLIGNFFNNHGDCYFKIESIEKIHEKWIRFNVTTIVAQTKHCEIYFDDVEEVRFEDIDDLIQRKIDKEVLREKFSNRISETMDKVFDNER